MFTKGGQGGASEVLQFEASYPLGTREKQHRLANRHHPRPESPSPHVQRGLPSRFLPSVFFRPGDCLLFMSHSDGRISSYTVPCSLLLVLVSLVRGPAGMAYLTGHNSPGYTESEERFRPLITPAPPCSFWCDFTAWTTPRHGPGALGPMIKAPTRLGRRTSI